jgi:outer membrane protein assembly factor BamB
MMRISTSLLAMTLCVASQAAFAASVVTLTPTTNHPGAVITVSGTGFGAGEAVDVYFDTTDTLLLVSSSAGALTGSITLPAAAVPGVHSVTAIGRQSGDAAQAPVTVSTAWLHFGFGQAHLAVNPYENVLSPSTAPALGTLWSVNLGTTGGTPAVYNGRVIVGTSTGVASVAAKTGKVNWNKNLGANFSASPTVVGATVYIGDLSGDFYALNASTGATLWTVKLPGYFYGSATVVNDVIYVGSYQGSFYALNANNGATLWSYSNTSGTDSSAAYVNGVVYFGGYDNKVYALNATTGALEWSYTTGGHVEGSPAVANGRLFVGSDDDKVYCIGTSAANAGNLLWSYTTGGQLYGSPTVYDGYVYIGSVDDNLYALNARNGSLYFSFQTDGLVRSASAANGVIYFTSQDSNAYAITTYGSSLTTMSIGASYFGSPAVADGTLYIATASGELYAFAPNAGADVVRALTAPAPESLRPDMKLEVTRPSLNLPEN